MSNAGSGTFLRFLEGIPRQSRFAVSGQLDPTEFNPDNGHIVTPNTGLSTFPLSMDSIESLMLECSQAPFGKGTATIVDTAVRNALQIEGSLCTLSENWQRQVQSLTQRCSSALGVDGAGLSARLHKLVVYPPGGHFKPHQDTEKEAGMLATLVVILPSRQGYTGGALRVQHNTATHRADFAGQSQEPGFAGAFACFFADCRHVVEPVLSGVRVCLTFNLVRTVHDFPVRPPAFRLPVPHFPPDHPMLYHMLEHEYTEANLSFGGLKGHDRTVAETMCARSWSGQNTMAAHFSTELGYPSALAQLIAAYCVEFDVSLCLVKVSVRGCPEGDPDVPEDIKMGAIRRTSTEALLWVDQQAMPASNKVTVPSLQLRESDIIEPYSCLWQGDPFVKDYTPYTGNEGPDLEHIYRKAVLAFWPCLHRETVCQVGGSVCLAELALSRVQQRHALAADTLERAVACFEQSYQSADLKRPSYNLGQVLRRSWDPVLQAIVFHYRHNQSSREHSIDQASRIMRGSPANYLTSALEDRALGTVLATFGVNCFLEPLQKMVQGASFFKRKRLASLATALCRADLSHPDEGVTALISSLLEYAQRDWLKLSDSLSALCTASFVCLAISTRAGREAARRFFHDAERWGPEETLQFLVSLQWPVCPYLVPMLRRALDLYAEVGFHPCGEFPVPSAKFRESVLEQPVPCAVVGALMAMPREEDSQLQDLAKVLVETVLRTTPNADVLRVVCWKLTVESVRRFPALQELLEWRLAQLDAQQDDIVPGLETKHTLLAYFTAERKTLRPTDWRQPAYFKGSAEIESFLRGSSRTHTFTDNRVRGRAVLLARYFLNEDCRLPQLGPLFDGQRSDDDDENSADGTGSDNDDIVLETLDMSDITGSHIERCSSPWSARFNNFNMSATVQLLGYRHKIQMVLTKTLDTHRYMAARALKEKEHIHHLLSQLIDTDTAVKHTTEPPTKRLRPNSLP